jgi:hypothetical protein
MVHPKHYFQSLKILSRWCNEQQKQHIHFTAVSLAGNTFLWLFTD